MDYVYAALLLHAAKKEINEANVLAVVKAAGMHEDPAKAKALVSALHGVNIEEALKAAATPVAVAAAPAAGHAPAKKEEKKEEKKSEEEASAGLASLFG